MIVLMIRLNSLTQRLVFLFAAVTFFFRLLINYINNNQVFYNPHFYFLFVGIGCLIFSLLFLFISVFPRVNYHKQSTIFWGSIRLHERSDSSKGKNI